MSIINKIIGKFNTVSIVGLAKNAGKTVTLNYLIEEAYKENITIGLTSTGRDGESIDLVTYTEKPTIYAVEGTIVATARKILDVFEAKVEILQVTDIKSSLGSIIIVKVKEAGNIQIAGPTNSIDIKKISKILIEYGANLVLVDGAINRKAASAPTITDACLISTGAVLSRDINKVVDITAFSIDCYRLNAVDKDTCLKLLSINKPCTIKKNGDIIEIDIQTSINAGNKFTNVISEETELIFVKGSLTNSLFQSLISNPYKKIFTIVVEDATKIFVDPQNWKEGKLRGMNFQVLYPINLIALTVNPVAPQGYYFNSSDLCNKLSLVVKDLDIIDVMK